jgi:Tfp pilus assembly protein PilZ
MENRKENRETKHIRILIKNENKSYPVTVSSISKTGMSVYTDQTFPTFKMIDIIVKIANQVIPIKGNVRWVNERPNSREDEKYEIGIALTNPPPVYIKHFD